MFHELYQYHRVNMTVISSTKQSFLPLALSCAITGQDLSQHCYRLSQCSSGPASLPFTHLHPHTGSALPRHDAKQPPLLGLSLYACATQKTYIPESGALYISLLALSLSKLSLLPFSLSMIFLEKSIYFLPGPIKPIRTAIAPPACLLRAPIYLCPPCCLHWAIFSKTSPLSSIKKCQRLCNFNLSLLPLMPISKTIHLKQKIQR